METASTSETSVNFHQSTRRYNPEDGHLHMWHVTLWAVTLYSLLGGYQRFGGKRRFPLQGKYADARVKLVPASENRVRRDANIQRRAGKTLKPTPIGYVRVK
jgi:hypothetical protein